MASIIDAMEEKYIDQELLNGMSVHMQALVMKCSKASARLNEALHHWCLGQLEWHLAGLDGVSLPVPTAKMDPMRSEFRVKIHSKTICLQESIARLASRCPRPPASETCGSADNSQWIRVASIAISGLEYTREWVARWSGIAVNFDASGEGHYQLF